MLYVYASRSHISIRRKYFSKCYFAGFKVWLWLSLLHLILSDSTYVGTTIVYLLRVQDNAEFQDFAFVRNLPVMSWTYVMLKRCCTDERFNND